jgi:hypothetical protein
MRNGTSTGADMPDYSRAQEMVAFDALPAEIRSVLRVAPFSVSAADMQANHLVMNTLRDKGADAPTWLSEQLCVTYKKKFNASS